MKITKQSISSAFILVGMTSLFAQQSPVTSVGNASGSNGSISYSVGQVVYATNTGTTGSVAQGLQQPFEIQTVLGTDNFNINLQMTVYPNPSVNNLTLDVKNYNLDNLHYQLFDLNGRPFISNKIVSETSLIQMEQYPAAVYFLKVVENNKEIKTFKIIKK